MGKDSEKEAKKMKQVIDTYKSIQGKEMLSKIEFANNLDKIKTIMIVDCLNNISNIQNLTVGDMVDMLIERHTITDYGDECYMVKDIDSDKYYLSYNLADVDTKCRQWLESNKSFDEIFIKGGKYENRN